MIVYVDIIDRCHLRCATCTRGARAMPNTRKQMPLDTFRKVVSKAAAEGAVSVNMFNWIEPFLCKNLSEYVQVLAEAKMPTSLSSTLSLPRIDALESVLAGVEYMLVSMSGYDQEVYQINHVGGRSEWVIGNLERIAVLRREGRIRTKVLVKFIQFNYNIGEEQKLRSLAERLDLDFVVEPGSGHPIKWSMADQKERVTEALSTFRADRPRDEPGFVCPKLMDHTVLDADGEVFLCCVFGNFDALKIGSYLDLSFDEILYRRYTHPLCNTCIWPRRAATDGERQSLVRACASHIGESALR